MSRQILYPALALCLCGFAAFPVPAPAQPSDSPPTPSMADLADTVDALDRQIAQHPDRVALRFERARVLEARGLPEQAMQDYRWLLNHRPELPEAYNNMARLLASRGDLSQAITLLEQGLATHPVYQLMFANLRALYESMASQAYRAALTEPASLEEVISADQPFSVELNGVESIDAAAGLDPMATGNAQAADESQADSARPDLPADRTRMAARDE